MEIAFRSDLSAEEVGQAVDQMEQAIRAAHEHVKYIFIEAKSLSKRPSGGSSSAEATV
jgi:divalent metal cation (Fe/Co/Zn/Cd) transporter